MRIDLSRRELITSGAASAALAVAPASALRRQETRRKMRLGLVTYNVAKTWDFDTILRHCKAAGWEAVEFRTTHAHGVEPSISAERRKEIKQKCADAGLLQTSLGTTCEFQMVDPEEVKRQIELCGQFAKLASDIGAKGVKVRPNGLPNGVPLDKTLQQIGKALVECGNVASGYGVEIWMEVHGNGTQVPANARAIMDVCNHPMVGVTWNSNGTDIVNGSVKESFDLLRKHIKCVHINDLWGSYPYRELFSLLNESKYDRFTLCEVGATMQPEDGVTFLKCYKGLWEELNR